MLARVKKDYRWKLVTAFSGVEFTKDEYRPVPTGFESAAQAHEALEVAVEQTPNPETVDAPRKRGGKKQAQAETPHEGETLEEADDDE